MSMGGCPPELPIMYIADIAVLWICIIVTILSIVVGVFGNLVSYVVIGYRDRKSQSSNFYLRCLALADTFSLLTGVILTASHMQLRPALNVKINDIDHFLNRISNYYPTCNIRIYVSFCSYLIATYIIVLFSLERCLVVMDPFKWMHRFTVNRAKIAIVISIIVIALTQLPLLWTFTKEVVPQKIYNETENGTFSVLNRPELLKFIDCDNETNINELYTINILPFTTYPFVKMNPKFLEENKRILMAPSLRVKCGSTCSFNYKFFNKFAFFHILLEFIIPFFLTGACNLIIFLKLKERNRDQTLNQIQQTSDLQKKSEKETTKKLILVSSTFLALSLPYAIFHVVTKIFVSNYCFKWAANFLTITMTIRSLNFCNNFFIYCLTERQFRKLVKTLITCNVKKLRRLKSYMHERPGGKATASSASQQSPNSNRSKTVNSTASTVHTNLLKSDLDKNVVLRKSMEDIHKYMELNHKLDHELHELEEEQCNPRLCDLPKDGYDSAMFSEQENLNPKVIRWSEVTPES